MVRSAIGTDAEAQPSRSRASAIAIESRVGVPSSIIDRVKVWVPRRVAGSAAAPASKLITARVIGTAVRWA